MDPACFQSPPHHVVAYLACFSIRLTAWVPDLHELIKQKVFSVNQNVFIGSLLYFRCFLGSVGEADVEKGVSHSALSMGFSRQEYCCGLPFPLPGVLPDPGIE